MTRRVARVLNLDAELELSRHKSGYVAPRKLQAQLAEHGQGSRRLLGPEDVLLDEARPQPSPELAALVGRAWCPTPTALQTMRASGVEPEPHPALSVLRRVNHRLFAHELGGGLPDQAYVKSRQELADRLGALERRWLLKRPLGFAGRGQLRVIGPLSQKQEEWIAASLSRDGLLVEPLVVPLLELSLHGFVWPDGRQQLGRICVQRVTARGHFEDVRLASDRDTSPEEAAQLVERATAVARALLGASYFGPFGIDGYRYRAGEGVGFCALSEINARYTLGFACGFPQHPSQLLLD